MIFFIPQEECILLKTLSLSDKIFFKRQGQGSAQILTILRASPRNLGSSPFQFHFQPVGLADLSGTHLCEDSIGKERVHHKERDAPGYGCLGPQTVEAPKGKRAVQIS